MGVSLQDPQAYGCSTLRSNLDAAGESGKQPEDADDDEVQRDDVVEKPRHEENQDAGDQRDHRADRDAHDHCFWPLEASCMSLPACSTDLPASPMALSTWRPAFSAGPPVPPEPALRSQAVSERRARKSAIASVFMSQFSPPPALSSVARTDQRCR